MLRDGQQKGIMEVLKFYDRSISVSCPPSPSLHHDSHFPLGLLGPGREVAWFAPLSFSPTGGYS